MKNILILLTIIIWNLNFVFAESWWANDLKWYEWLALVSYYLIINPITWIILTLIVWFFVFKIIKKKRKK